jgi:SAM-dependent methyltransferase
VLEMQYGSKERFCYLECYNCRSLQIENIPPDLTRYYPPDYLGSQPFHTNVRGSFREIMRNVIRRQRTAYLLHGRTPIGWAANRWRTDDDLTAHLLALRPISARKSACILDVGCGPGYLLQRLQDSGYKHLQGQDPFQKWTVPGVTVHRCQLGELSGQFDLIMLHHSLEHTPNPLQVLANVGRLLNPDGSVLIRIPLAASEAWSQYGVNWYQIDAPRHLVIPSEIGMVLMAQRAGMTISMVRYDSDETQFLCSEQYRRGIPLRDAQSYYKNPHQTLFDISEIARAKAWSQKVNRGGKGDQACFHLRAV